MLYRIYNTVCTFYYPDDGLLDDPEVLVEWLDVTGNPAVIHGQIDQVLESLNNTTDTRIWDPLPEK